MCVCKSICMLVVCVQDRVGPCLLMLLIALTFIIFHLFCLFLFVHSELVLISSSCGWSSYHGIIYSSFLPNFDLLSFLNLSQASSVQKTIQTLVQQSSGKYPTCLSFLSESLNVPVSGSVTLAQIFSYYPCIFFYKQIFTKLPFCFLTISPHSTLSFLAAFLPNTNPHFCPFQSSFFLFSFSPNHKPELLYRQKVSRIREKQG